MKKLTLLKDFVNSTKQIRKNNGISTESVDNHIGFMGICEAIEAGQWHFDPLYKKGDTLITMSQLFAYINFINSGIAAYNKIESKQDEAEVNDLFKPLLNLLKLNYRNTPKFV